MISREQKNGFTLIELLVVISIISLLSSVVLSSLSSARTKARDARRMSDLGQINKAIILYADSNNGSLPTNNWWFTSINNTNSAPEYQAFKTNIGPYFGGTLPEDPSNTPGTCTDGFCYYYGEGYIIDSSNVITSTGATAKDYVICSKLQNPPSGSTITGPLSTSFNKCITGKSF